MNILRLLANNGVAPSTYTSQSQLVSDYNGATDVVGSPRDFQKGADFDNIIQPQNSKLSIRISGIPSRHYTNIGSWWYIFCYNKW